MHKITRQVFEKEPQKLFCASQLEPHGDMHLLRLASFQPEQSCQLIRVEAVPWAPAKIGIDLCRETDSRILDPSSS